MVWTLTTTRTTPQGNRKTTTHHMMASSLTEAISKFAPFIGPELEFRLSNIL